MEAPAESPSALGASAPKHQAEGLPCWQCQGWSTMHLSCTTVASCHTVHAYHIVKHFSERLVCLGRVHTTADWNGPQYNTIYTVYGPHATLLPLNSSVLLSPSFPHISDAYDTVQYNVARMRHHDTSTVCRSFSEL